MGVVLLVRKKYCIVMERKPNHKMHEQRVMMVIKIHPMILFKMMDVLVHELL